MKFVCRGYLRKSIETSPTVCCDIELFYSKGVLTHCLRVYIFFCLFLKILFLSLSHGTSMIAVSELLRFIVVLGTSMALSYKLFICKLFDKESIFCDLHVHIVPHVVF